MIPQMRIDAHLHFWQPACGFDNRPIADHVAYRRDFLPEQVLSDLDACGIDGMLLVQTCPQTEETQWLLELARRTPRVLGVTAWVDLDQPSCDFATLTEDALVVGIRAQLRRIADSAFVTRSTVVANLAAALCAGLNVTLLAEARHYAHVIDLLPRLPAGPVTLNHLGLPFPDVDRASWRALMGAFAQRPASYVQLSGLPFLYGGQWRTPVARSLMDEALDLLGPERLLFASDWPMLLRFATYAEWTEAVETFLDEKQLTSTQGAAVFGGNALAANPRLAARTQNPTTEVAASR